MVGQKSEPYLFTLMMLVTLNTIREKTGVLLDVARSSDGSAIRYVFPVLWMTSYFHITERISQNQR